MISLRDPVDFPGSFVNAAGTPIPGAIRKSNADFFSE